MYDVQAFAIERGLLATLDRAISFHPTIRTRLYATPVAWSARLKTSAGYANTKFGITLHPRLNQVGPESIDSTFLHEVAHIMQWLVYGKIDHGATWWEMMHQLGQQPVRCHNYGRLGKAEEITGSDFD